MKKLHNRTIFITGASRGIGCAIALACARDGANIVIAAKSAEPHPKLSGTIYSVAKEVTDVGGNALPIQLDVRDEGAIQQAMQQAVAHFGGLDVLINNASAISLSSTPDTPIKKFDLMFDVNVRATFACSQAAIPYLEQSDNPHILTLSPPLNMDKKHFKEYVAYTISKYGMSMCTLGMAQELKSKHIAVNSLWPKTTIATAAIQYNFPKHIYEASRKPEIVADAAYWILTQDSKKVSGNFFIDETVLRHAGVTEFEQYAVNPKVALFSDLYI